MCFYFKIQNECRIEISKRVKAFLQNHKTRDDLHVNIGAHSAAHHVNMITMVTEVEKFYFYGQPNVVRREVI